MSARAATAVGGALKGAGDSVSKLREKSSPREKPRRTAAAPRRTAPAPQTRRSARAQQAERSQHQAPAPGTKDKKRNRIIAAGALAGVLGIAAFMNSEMDDAPAAAPAAAVAPAPAAPQDATPTAPPTPVAAETAPTAETEGQIVADVPLFGPTALATAQPEPLSSLPKAEEIPEERHGAVEDESFDDAPAEAAPSARKAAKPFTQGRLHLPTIHRIRLDSPGEALAGTRTPTGFSVLVPERKAMESGKVIAKRDDRIVKVNTKNTAQGAKVTFVFRKNVPPYKVRLKKDFIEFFISAPERK